MAPACNRCSLVHRPVRNQTLFGGLGPAGRYSTSAEANGLCFESPSKAVDAAFAAKAIIVFGLLGSTLARPRPIARAAIVRFIVLAKGLSRQASRMNS